MLTGDKEKENLETSSQEEREMEIQEETITWTQSVGAAVLAPEFRINNNTCRTPVSKPTVIHVDDDKTPVNNSMKAPIRNFSLMNVKEKVTAYEEIILISPATVEKKKSTRSSCKSISPKTPTNVETVSNTPDTVVQNKVASVVTRDSTDSGHESEVVSEMTEKKTQKKDTPRISASRKSLRTSLHVLPSRQKLSGVPTEVCH